MAAKIKSWGLITRLLKDYPQAGNGRPWGSDRRPKGDVGKRSFSNEARSAERKQERDKLVSIFIESLL